MKQQATMLRRIGDAPKRVDIWPIVGGAIAGIAGLCLGYAYIVGLAHMARDIAEEKDHYVFITLADGSKYACPSKEAIDNHAFVCKTDAECVDEFYRTFQASPHICGD